jgi:hypothetical protein
LTKTQTISLTVIVPSFSLTANATSATVTAGSSTAITYSTAVINGFKSAITLSVTGLPTGVTAKFSPASIASPGTGSSTLTLTAVAGKVAGAYALTVTASGGVTKTQTLSLMVIGSDFTLTLGGTKVIVARGGSVPITITTAVVDGFKAAVALSVSGAPSGVTASFAPTSIASPGSGSSKLTLKVASSAAVKTSTLTVSASGGGVTHTQTLSLTVK